MVGRQAREDTDRAEGFEMHVPVRRVLLLLVGAAFLFPGSLAAQSSPRTITTQDLTQTKSGGSDWITSGGALNNQRYSTLDQVNTTNVSQLKGVWMTRLGSGKGSKYRFEADPLVVDGIMYIPTGNDDVFALDAKTGKQLWAWYSDIPQVNDLICCGWDNRGVAVGDGRVYTGLLDGGFVALDQKTGQLLWRTQLEDYHDGYSLTGAYRYYDGLVFTGISGAEKGIRGRVTALDARDGHEVWRFYTIPAPGELGGDTWPSPNDSDPEKVAAYTHGGASVWQAPTIDPDLGLLYFTTGNAGPDYYGALRPGDNLFSASFVALDYKTGAYKWHYQQVHHDIWDFDAPSPTVLFDQTYNGVTRKGIYESSKTGWVYFLDRATGQPLIGIDEKPVPQEARNATAATQPYPVGDSFMDQCPEPLPNVPLMGCIFTPFWDLPVLLRPTGSGGTEWSPTTYSPQTGYVYTMAQQTDSTLAMRYLPYQYGKTYSLGASVPALGASIKSTFTAMDSRTNKIAWQQVNDGEQSYGALSTAGGLVFKGQVDGNLVALDAASGNQLWRFQTGLGISAPPMTWSDGKDQYVTVAVGGNRGGATTLDGDQVWTFSLNGLVDQMTAPPPIQTKVDITGAPVKIGDRMAPPQTVFYGDKFFDGTLYAEDYTFTPQLVQVPVGTTMTWINNGSVAHTATAMDGTWDTGDIPGGGGQAAVTFSNTGTFYYYCTPHPWMSGKIIVQ
jgi:alcohol dehydrogenase (cytochrome c)